MAAYTFNSMDRTIISILASSIKADLKLTDTQFGLLGGTAFAMLYALGGIPIARLAERVSRVNIITVALIVWSGLTALCGAAATFRQLLLIRVGVGVAEAGCSPPAHSLISDYIEPVAARLRPLGLLLRHLARLHPGGGGRGISSRSVSAGAGPARRSGCRAIAPRCSQGTGARARAGRAWMPKSAANAAGAVLDSPRAAELERGRRRAALRPTHPAHGPRRDRRSASRPMASMFHARLFRPRIRAGLPPPSGSSAALTGGLAVGVGIFAGGFVADALARASPRWYALVPALGGTIRCPCSRSRSLASDWKIGDVGRWRVAGFFWYASLGPTFGAVQNAVEPRRRATATAFLYICLDCSPSASAPCSRLGDRSIRGRELRVRGHPLIRGRLSGRRGRRGRGRRAEFGLPIALALATRRGLLADARILRLGDAALFLAAAGMATLEAAALAQSRN